MGATVGHILSKCELVPADQTILATWRLTTVDNWNDLVNGCRNNRKFKTRVKLIGNVLVDPGYFIC